MTGRSNAVKGADEHPVLTGSNRPMLLFFTSQTNGRCRRAEGFLAQVLQRRHNHDTFAVHYVDREERPDLAERFRVDDVPTLVVVHEKTVRGRERWLDGVPKNVDER